MDAALNLNTGNDEDLFGEEITDFLKDKPILIYDASKNFGTSAKQVFKEFGCKPDQLRVISKERELFDEINDFKPHVLILDSRFEKFSLREVIGGHKSICPSRIERLCIVTTSQEADKEEIATSFEDDVDGVLLKPLSTSKLAEVLKGLILKKAFPSPYLQLIVEGEAAYIDENYDIAKESFETAIQKNQDSGLAYFYLGEIALKKKEHKEALACFRKGCENKVHRRCLMAEIDTLSFLERYQAAYRKCQLARELYPLSAHWLEKVITLAVYSHHFEDFDLLYKDFNEIDERPTKLCKVMSAAFMVRAKSKVKEGDVEEAVEDMRKSVICSQRDTKQIERAVSILLESNQPTLADKVFELYPPDATGTENYEKLNFHIKAKVLNPIQIATQGRDMLRKGHKILLIYEETARALAGLGQKQAAENILLEAEKAFPDEKKRLSQLLDS